MNSSAVIKKIIAVIVSAVILVAMYYGSYVPLKKSSTYIAMLRRLPTIHSIKDFSDGFGEALDIVSPIGQEELVRNSGNLVVGLIQTNGGGHPEVVVPLLGYVNHYYDPLIARGKGMSFGQNLYVMGSVYLSAYEATKTPEYLGTAERYFQQGNEGSSTRPQFLYGLLEVSLRKGDATSTRRIAEEILTYWPGDTTTRDILEKAKP